MKKGTLCLWSGIIGTVLGMSWGINANGREEVAGMGAVLFLFSLFVLLPFGIFRRVKAKRSMTEEEKACADAERERKVAETQRRLEEMRAARTIVSTAIVDTTMKSKTKASAGSSIVRGAVGGALFGPVGMVTGAVTPKKTTITKAKTVTFSVRYANGECRLETVKNGSARFKELAKYLA